MSSQDRYYFMRRAEEELERARTANDGQAMRAHLIMAGHYLDLASNETAADKLLARAKSDRQIA